jgi:polysaccharide biosynthesis protein PslH
VKVLYTTPVLEHPAAGGPQLRIENSILALNMVCELHVVSRVEQRRAGGVESEHFFRQNCCKFSYVPSVNGISANRYVRKIQRLYKKYFTADDVDFILNYTDHYKIDVVWFGYGNISYDLIKKIKEKQPNLKVVCDTDSVWSRYILRELPYENDPVRRREIECEGKLKEQEEREWVNLCEVTTAVSEVDAEYYRELASFPERIKVFSNVINLNTYSHAVTPPTGFRKPCFYLAGSFFSPDSSMAKGARWVISEVLPLVRREIPDIHFYIVGKGSKEILKDIKDQGITITGKLPSVLQYLCNADVSIVPLSFESGTRFKILEAAACGIPIVSTTLGAEGIPIADGENILIADDTAGFAGAIVRIVRNKSLGAFLSDNCKQLIQTNYSITTLAREAEEIFSFLAVH